MAVNSAVTVMCALVKNRDRSQDYCNSEVHTSGTVMIVDSNVTASCALVEQRLQSRLLQQ